MHGAALAEVLPSRSPAVLAADARPPASVVICAYSEDRWELLVEAIHSAQRQSVPPLETIVVVDHNPALLARIRRELPGVVAVESSGAPGLAGARNTGVAAASGSVVAFLDDDALAEEAWLEKLTAPYDNPSVMGSGGAVRPMWATPRPRWFPPEFDWVVGCSYRGLPAERAPIRNPIGANMSFRREVFQRAGGFREGIGRVGRWPVGCEETELAIRAYQVMPGTRVLFDPAAAVDHHVPADRATPRYFASRCFAEGLSKALVAGHVGSDDALASERRYVVTQLGSGVVRGLVGALRGDAGGLLRAAAIGAGLAMTSAGYAMGTLRRRRGSA
jgi:GT2 family glycosyltransferase